MIIETSYLHLLFEKRNAGTLSEDEAVLLQAWADSHTDPEALAAESEPGADDITEAVAEERKNRLHRMATSIFGG